MIYDKAMHEARKYWRERIESMSFEGHIALGHPRRKDGPPQFSSIEQALEPETHALLRRLAAGNPFLSYTVLVLALKVCSYKYSGDPRVTLFSPAMTGSATASVLPISSTLDGGASFKDALVATKELLAGAYRFQQYPWSRMLLDLPEKSRPQQLPMVASMAGFSGELPEDACDLAVHFETTEQGTRLTCRFDPRLYEVVTLQGFFRSFNAILRQGLGKMATRIADLRAESGEASAGPGAPSAASVETDGALLHRLFEAQAAKHQERVAVVQGQRTTTYETLDRHARQLAQTLAALGLEVRRPVVLLMDAGPEMLASMLAVLKLGGAFVPVKLLSTRGPLTRILEAVDAECILCQPGHVDTLRQGEGGLEGIAHLITVEGAAESGDSAPPLSITRHETHGTRARSAARTLPPGTACVLVDDREDTVSCAPVLHAELVHLFGWLHGRSGIGAEDRCLLSPGLGACEQLHDTLGMLTAGASVEIADAASLQDTAMLAERLMAPGVTVWDLPTPLMQNVLADLIAVQASREGARGPRVILLSGEKQCLHLAERLRRYFPEARLTGLYANPAVGLWTTFFPLSRDAAEPDARAVAQAIPGFEHRLLNRAGEPAPLHSKGELHLVRTLPGTPEVKTRLRAEPLGGGRMRWLRDESHSFVKYGCRVELTKVEAALCEHEHILAAEVVTLQPEHETASRVVAFLLADESLMSPEAARDGLVDRDGVDVIPDRFILMDEFPLTADGAIDRELLARRFATSLDSRDSSLRLQVDEVQKQLKGLWLEILQVDEVGDGDSFFTRGGNSLKATLLLARIKEDFSVDLSVQHFFREPNLRAVAQLIAAEAGNAPQQKGSEFKLVARENYRVQLPDVERPNKTAAERT